MSTHTPSRRPPAAPPPAPAPSSTDSVADLLRRLGSIPPGRVRLSSIGGGATPEDVLTIHDREGRLFELVEGVLVEKAMGYEESELGLLIGSLLLAFVRPRRLGHVTGADGAMQLFPGLVRIPDVAFVSAVRLPVGKRPRAPIPDLVPDLAVEVLSKSNTSKEIRRKLGEYFGAGVRLVWIVDPRRQTVRVHTIPGRSTTLGIDDTLDGGEVLPGFRLELRELFPADQAP